MNIAVGRLIRERVISSGFNVLNATGLHRLAATFTRGRGAILMFHHVRPWGRQDFAPNRLLEITPDFFEIVLQTVRESGFEIVPLDTALGHLERPAGEGEKPFVVLTFDDGYRDNRDHALPIMRRHNAPFTLFVTTGFADRTARLWWLELEEAIRALPHLSLDIDGQRVELPAGSAAEKQAAFQSLYWMLRPGPEERMLAVISSLCAQAGIDTGALAARYCMDWSELRDYAADPLCTIGAHTLTHPMLAKHDADFARREVADSKAIIERELGREVKHFAYPVGDPGSAGPREFALAAELGFRSGVTTRPGMVFDEHAPHLLALPRLSVNGTWQQKRYLEVLLSGAPFALWNRGRKVNVG
jgi:peptidoglycan/xylan/chitin deacetylase (PgdA/CDA1 family)